MKKINLLKKILKILFFSLIFLVFVEFSYRFLKKLNKNNEFVNRTMLFQYGNNFVNHSGFFNYYPNNTIRSLTIYSKSKTKNISDLVIEYDNLISSNNAGLIMKNDIKNFENVIYIIGDSFTEGQGDSPWFYKTEKLYRPSDFKLVNLGILGTGPVQWNNLKKHIDKKFNLTVKGSVINIIINDMIRAPWIFNERELMCLKTAICDYRFGFQGFIFENNLSNIEIKKKVLTTLTSQNETIKNLKDIVKQSKVITDIYFLIKKIKNIKIIKNNEKALLDIKESSQNNLFVNIVSNKSINSQNYTNFTDAKNLIKFFKVNKFNFNWCDIPSDGFHKNDGHPNNKGYKILRSCTEKAIEYLSK